MKLTLLSLALVAAAGVSHAQMQAPSTPGGRAMDSMPGGTSNPNTALPKTPSNASAAEAAAKAQLEARGYSGVRSLTRDPAGNWAAKAMRNNIEVAVIVQVRKRHPMSHARLVETPGGRGIFEGQIATISKGLLGLGHFWVQQ